MILDQYESIQLFSRWTNKVIIGLPSDKIELVKSRFYTMSVWHLKKF